MPRFVIDLGDIEMTGEAQRALRHALQKVALSHVAAQRTDIPFALRCPPGWLGAILRREVDSMIPAAQCAEAQQVVGDRTAPSAVARPARVAA